MTTVHKISCEVWLESIQQRPSPNILIINIHKKQLITASIKLKKNAL